MGCAHTPPQKAAEVHFQFKRDTLAFPNELVWDYHDGEPTRDSSENSKEKYTQHCFVMARSVVQFWKTARFDSNLPKLNRDELIERVRQVSRADVWRDPLESEERIVFPGYKNLYDLSSRETDILKKNIGESWPTYFRAGNFCIIETPSQAHQSRTNEELQEWIGKHHPMILWVYNFPSRDINHVVVAFDRESADQKNVYWIYDPNDPNTPRKLIYDPVSKSFLYPKTSYYAGGKVSVRPIYLSMLQ
jgi:hypothetical protein